MGEVVNFTLETRFVVTLPSKPLRPNDRMAATYHLIKSVAPSLHDPGRRGSAYRLLAYCSLVGVANVEGAHAAARAAEEFARQMRYAARRGWCAGPANDLGPKPAA